MHSVEERRVCQDRRAGVRLMPRPAVLTQATLAYVTSLVDQGRRAAEIAMHLRDPESPVFPAWNKSSAPQGGRDRNGFGPFRRGESRSTV
jgi:hypothetical protein